MNCPYCASTTPTRLSGRTSLGYLTFRCSKCSKRLNERTASSYNHLQYHTDIVLLYVSAVTCQESEQG
jgi:putative transposase